MHPITKKKFGVHGIAVMFNNGTTVVPGYIVKQIGTRRYKVTNGTVTLVAVLAQTPELVAALPVGMMTISVGSEHVAKLFSKHARTVEGHIRTWSLDTSVNGSLIISKYS